MKQKIKQLFLLQDKFNKEVNPNWITANYSWETAIFVETSELIDSLGYKWWKHTVPDMDNSRVELVDILHFLLSKLMTIMTMEKGVDLLTTSLSGYDFSLGSDGLSKLISKSLIKMNSELTLGNFEEAVNWFSFVASIMFDNFDDVFNLYMVKNVLNKFRQNNGYKEGTYKKHWNFNGDVVEDNKVAESILKNGITDFEKVYSKLETIYSETV